MTIRKVSFVVAFVAVLFAGSASAQDKSSWGVSVDLTPRWEQMSFLKTIAGAGSDLRVEGQEIRFGLVRGRVIGGDWGVSLVYGKIDSSSFQRKRTGESSFCNGPVIVPVCNKFEIDREYYFRSVSLLGLETHKYVPFGTIAKRIQLGMNFGGGVLLARGTAEKDIIITQTINGVEVSKSRTTQVISGREAFRGILHLSVIPTGRIEAVVGVIVTDHVKVKVGGGLNFPGQHLLTVGTTYLF